jgi:hypothetical protein
MRDRECLAGFSDVQTALPAIQEITGRLFRLIPGRAAILHFDGYYEKHGRCALRC